MPRNRLQQVVCRKTLLCCSIPTRHEGLIHQVRCHWVGQRESLEVGYVSYGFLLMVVMNRAAVYDRGGTTARRDPPWIAPTDETCLSCCCGIAIRSCSMGSAGA